MLRVLYGEVKLESLHYAWCQNLTKTLNKENYGNVSLTIANKKILNRNWPNFIQMLICLDAVGLFQEYKGGLKLKSQCNSTLYQMKEKTSSQWMQENN